MSNTSALLSSIHIDNIFKIGILLILVLFIVFLFVVLKQIESMNKIVTQPYIYPILRSVALILIGLTLALTVVAVIIL